MFTKEDTHRHITYGQLMVMLDVINEANAVIQEYMESL